MPVIGVVLAVLIVFISALDFVNATMTYFGQRVGIEDLTLQVRGPIRHLSRNFNLSALCKILPTVSRALSGTHDGSTWAPCENMDPLCQCKGFKWA